jgi:two-component system, OmpR family, KDP operon response regulator KdpE
MATLIHRALQREGLAVDVAADGERAVLEATAVPYDVILLDRMLPGIDGAEVCRRLRSVEVRAPILMLTAMGEIPHRVEGLDAGADDYLTKPFSTLELQARVRAMLRRASRAGDAPMGRVVAGEVEIDLVRRTVRRRGVEVHLTPTEWGLLRAFVAHRGRTLTHHQLFHEVWGRSAGDAQQYLRVYVGQLRRKLERDPVRPTLIRTEPAVGYRFEPES